MTSAVGSDPTSARIVRYAPEGHAEGLLDVLASMQYERYPGPVAGSSRQSWQSWLERVGMLERFVALSPSGAVVGHVGLARGNANAVLAGVAPETAEVVRLFVHPHWRKLGVGGNLLDQATESALLAHSSAVLLVSDYLTSALTLYLSRGWVVVGHKVADLSKDRLWVCRLDSSPAR